MNADSERVQKVLAHAGVASRRAVEELIAGGRVMVNGQTARLGQRIDPSKDVVEVDGSRVLLDADLVHYLVNKPAGVVTTAHDPQGRPTVLDLVDAPVRVWPVGRLDIATEGAVIVTNDGDLTQRLTHPSFGVPKTYVAEVAGSIGADAVRVLRTGVALADGVTAPASVKVVTRGRTRSLVEITIKQGRNRQVRRMLEAVDHPVQRLVRVAMGPIRLGRLKPGTIRRLKSQEVRALYREAGL
ncbi:MAG: pseudouridine synthase [Actinomycetota bacterium]